MRSSLLQEKTWVEYKRRYLMSKHRQAFYISLCEQHNSYWDKLKDKMERYMQCYVSEYWQGLSQELEDFEHFVEVPYAHNIIEQYITSIFLRDPAVAMKADPLTQADADAVETIVNRWINSSRTALENATKLALLYPNSFLRIYPDKSLLNEKNPTSYLEVLCVEALSPWEVIVDQEASSWENQRFIGSICQISSKLVSQRFNRRVNGLTPKEKKFYFDTDGKPKGDSSAYGSSQISTPEDYLYINIVEMYDLIEGTYTVFTEDHEDGYYEFTHTEIPVRDYSTKPLVPIIPLYFSWRPDKPMIGISTMARVYPLLKEKNDLRTHQANATRSDTRKYLTNKKVLDDSFVELLQSSVDGLYIPVDTDMPLSTLIYPIPLEKLSANHDTYSREIDADLATATLYAPFTRGEVTKATATEIGVLSQYTSSEQSKMERQKNECLERIAKFYVRWLALQIGDSDETITIEVDDEAKIISSNTFSGKFSYSAADEDSTPLSSAIKNQQALTLAPQLINLGADPNKIREGLVKMFKLPKDWADAMPLPQESMSESNTPNVLSDVSTPTQEEVM